MNEAGYGCAGATHDHYGPGGEMALPNNITVKDMVAAGLFSDGHINRERLDELRGDASKITAVAALNILKATFRSGLGNIPGKGVVGATADKYGSVIQLNFGITSRDMQAAGLFNAEGNLDFDKVEAISLQEKGTGFSLAGRT